MKIFTVRGWITAIALFLFNILLSDFLSGQQISFETHPVMRVRAVAGVAGSDNQLRRSWDVFAGVRPTVNYKKITLMTGMTFDWQANTFFLDSKGFVTASGHGGIAFLYEARKNYNVGLLYRRIMHFQITNSLGKENFPVMEIFIRHKNKGNPNRFYYNQYGVGVFYRNPKTLIRSAELFAEIPVNLKPLRLFQNWRVGRPYVAVAFVSVEIGVKYNTALLKGEWTFHSPGADFGDLQPLKGGSGSVLLRLFQYYEVGWKQEFSPVGNSHRSQYFFLGARI